MINSLSKNRGLVLGAAMGIGVYTIANLANAQEKPRSLVPSFVEEQAGQKTPNQQEEVQPAQSAPSLSRPLAKNPRVILKSGTGGSLVVEQLDALTPGSIGLIGDADGGFGSQMWVGTPIRLISALLEKLPVPDQSFQMLDLYRRLLLTGAVLTGNAENTSAVLGLRVRKLIAAGRIEDASALIERLRNNALTSNLRAASVDLALLAGADEKACRLVRQYSETQSKNFLWSKYAIFCQLLAEQFDKAELNVALLEEQSEKDDAFMGLFARLAGDNNPVSVSAAAVKPLHLAMMRRAQLPYDTVLVEAASQDILGGMSRTPALLGDLRISAVMQAVTTGATTIDQLQEALIAAAKNTEKLPEDQASYARLYAAIKLEKDLGEKANLLSSLWALAREMGHFPVISKVSVNELLQITPADYGYVFNLDAVRVLLLNGYQSEAAVWERVIRRTASQGVGQKRLQGRAEVTRLDSYMLLSGANGIARWNSASFAGWKKATELDERQGEKTVFLLSLLEVFGYPVSSENWQESLFMDLPLQTASNNHALERNLIAAAAAGRVGETVALSLLALGDAGPAKVTTTTLMAVTSSLKAVGLEKEARNLALEAAIHKDL